MDQATVTLAAEALLRIVLGWRMLISGVSNLRRWPNPVNTASILFPRGASFFGSVATFLMIAGGLGLVLGWQTPLSALMTIVFLIPTFALHAHWLKTLPAMAPVVKDALSSEKARAYFRSFDRQAYHAHEVGLRDNLVFVAAAAYFLIRGTAAFGLDPWLDHWVVRLF